MGAEAHFSAVSMAEAHFSALLTAEAHFSAVSPAEAHFSAVSMAEAHFSAMGSTAHVMVVASSDAEGLVQFAGQRIAELQARWSRFEPDSEISRLNRQRTLTGLSPDTVTLLRAARTAWRATDGLFDPTMAGVMNRLGYDRDFRQLMAIGETARGRPPMSHAVGDFIAGGMGQLLLDEDGASARLPAGAQFDPGGIGKGLAADIVCRELLDAGAAGALVNLGGDVRVMGEPPSSTGIDDSTLGRSPASAWTIDIEDPLRPSAQGCCIARASVRDGAVASSSTLRRRWHGASGETHHLIDPRTGAPAEHDIVASTVVAAEAWWAEALTKVLVLGGSAELLRGAGALVVRSDGSIELLGDHERFLTVDTRGDARVGTEIGTH